LSERYFARATWTEKNDVARYKRVDRSPRFFPIVLESQRVPGSLEHALDTLIDCRTEIEVVTSLITFSVPAGTELPAHNAPQPCICIVLSGEGEVMASDGSIVRLGPRGVLYCDDVSGKGHVTRSITDLSLAFVNRAGV
jgi:hypothetical protein